MCRVISETAEIAHDCTLGDNVVIEENVRIGPGSEIGHGVIIYKGTTIGSNVSVEANSVLGRQPKAGLGSAHRTREQPPLVIADEVVIGACVVLYAGTKLDNKAMIADHASVREGCTIGESSIIGRGTTIERDSEIGARVKMQCACHITVGVIIEDDVFFGTEVCTMNDKYMGTREAEKKGPHIKRGSAIGSNATILPGVVVGEKAIIGAGSVVTKDIPDSQTYVGVPAKALKR